MGRLLLRLRQALRRFRKDLPERDHPWVRLARHFPADPILDVAFWFPDLEAWVGDHGYRMGSMLPTPQRWLRLGIGDQGLLLEEGWGLLPSGWPRLGIPWVRVRRAVLASQPAWPQEAGLNLWVEAESMEAGAREFFDEMRIWIAPTSPGFEELVRILADFVPIEREGP